MALHEFVYAMNNTFKKLITRTEGTKMKFVMEDFKVWCELLSIQGAIIGTHISIPKPFYFLKIYFNFINIRRHFVVVKVVVDYKK
jgi:hypothetical protein